MAEWKKIIVSGSNAHLTSVSASNLTNDNILVAGTNGAVESSGITWDGSSLNIGGGTITNFTGSAAIVSGSFSGSFVGNGAGLTGVTAAVDIDSLDALGGTGLHQTEDHFIFSDDGTEKKITFSNLEDAIFDNVSGDATIAAGGALTIAADSVEGTMLNTNAADTTTIELSGDTLSVLKVPNALTAGAGLTAPGTFDGANARIFSVDSGSLLPFISSSVFGTVSGDVTINDAGVATIQANSVTLGTDTTGNYIASASEGAGIDLTFTPGETANVHIALDLTEVIASDGANRVLTSDGDGTLTGEANMTFDGNTLTIPTGSVSGDLTVQGNLTVQGTTTTLDTTNLIIEDRYILLNSGSSAANNDSGIIFGGSSGAANQGHAIIWDGSYNSNDGRLAIKNSLASTATGDQTPNYYLAGFFEGSAADAATAEADHKGNIRVDSDGDIFIYV